jgi:hypothetical protein
VLGSPTLPHFVRKFKHNTGNMNQNQLVMAMGTFQSQLQALSINWGGTDADGEFEIFSSRRCGQKVRNLDLTDNVVLYYSTDSDGVLTLMGPVDFLKCYSFMCNLALDTVPSLDSI